MLIQERTGCFSCRHCGLSATEVAGPFSSCDVSSVVVVPQGLVAELNEKESGVGERIPERTGCFSCRHCGLSATEVAGPFSSCDVSSVVVVPQGLVAELTEKESGVGERIPERTGCFSCRHCGFSATEVAGPFSSCDMSSVVVVPPGLVAELTGLA